MLNEAPPRHATDGLSLVSFEGVEDETLLHLVGGGVEVVVEVPGGGHHQLAGTHGAHLVTGQGVDVHRAQWSKVVCCLQPQINPITCLPDKKPVQCFLLSILYSDTGYYCSERVNNPFWLQQEP